jgi:hypothetical protein
MVAFMNGGAKFGNHWNWKLSMSFLELCLDIIITFESHIENLSNVKFMIFTSIFESLGKDQILRKRYVLVILILHVYLLAHSSFKFPIPMVSKFCAAIHEVISTHQT